MFLHKFYFNNGIMAGDTYRFYWVMHEFSRTVITFLFVIYYLCNKSRFDARCFYINTDTFIGFIEKGIKKILIY